MVVAMLLYLHIDHEVAQDLPERRRWRLRCILLLAFRHSYSVATEFTLNVLAAVPLKETPVVPDKLLPRIVMCDPARAETPPTWASTSPFSELGGISLKSGGNASGFTYAQGPSLLAEEYHRPEIKT